MDWQGSHHSQKKISDTKAHKIECWLACKLRPSWCNTLGCSSSQWTPWKGWSLIWHWHTQKECKIKRTKTKSPYIMIIVFTRLLGLILATNSLFNTSPSSLDLLLEIAYWSKLLVDLEGLPLVFEIAYWSEILTLVVGDTLNFYWMDILLNWIKPN